MSRLLIYLVAVSVIGIGSSAFSIAQEEPTTPVAAIDVWQGKVFLRRAGTEEFEIVAPAAGEKVSLSFGDTIKTSDAASVTINMVDGTVIGLGPNSEVVIERSPEGLVIARLLSGEADVAIGSDEFRFVCARHTISGKDSRVRVQLPGPDSVNIFAIEEGAVVENEYGLTMYLDQGQKIESSYVEEKEVFLVHVHEYNEMDLKIEIQGEGMLIKPGDSFTVDAEGNFVPEAPPPSPLPPPPIVAMEEIEAEDEPFENMGDLKTGHMVSPKKP